MRTRSQARISVPEPPVRQPSVESSNLEKPDNPPIVTMADNRTMAQLLEAPTEGYEDAIVIPEITANNFEIKHGLLNLVQNKQFFGNDKEDPHAHIRYFNKITSTMKFPNVPSTSVKLMLFPFSLEGQLILDRKSQTPASAPVKAVEQSCAAAANFNQANSLIQLYLSGSGTLPGNTVTNPKEDLKGITTRSGVTIQGPKAVNHDAEVTNGALSSSNNGITETSTLLLFKFSPRNPNLSQCAPVVTPKLFSGSSFNKVTKKLGDPGRFLIPCEFTGITTCNALADLGASINLMPYSVWNNLSLPELTPTCMTLELADRSITKRSGSEAAVRAWSEGASARVNVGKFQFPADFVVVDFEPDPRVPLILGRCFLKTSHALIDVYEGEITLRVGKEAITFNLDQTSRYTADYNHMTVNKIDVIDMACDEYSQEVLGFSNVIASGNPTPYFEPIVSTASLNLTPFGDSDFLLMEEADSFLALEDDPTSSEVDPTYQDPEGDILILEAILNSEPPPPLPNHEQYMPGGRKELKLCEAKTVEPSINEPPEVELKELPPHLEYAFLEGDDKLPVIIAKDLKDEEKAALLKVLKSHKRAIAWKLSDIKGVSPEFCTHKILMEEDYEPSVQSQRRVNPKIHDVIKKEVEKLLDAGLIYDSSFTRMLRQDSCGGSYCSKNLTLKFETKKELRISPPIICPGLEITRIQVNSRTKKSMKNSSRKNLGSIALQDQCTPSFADFADYHAGKFVSREDIPNKKIILSK
ncbi:reverse transcriptase domain-containing protein [Tanacetum coccineum]